jgi:transposase
VKRFKQVGTSLPKPSIADKWSAEEKFAVVSETLSFSEIEVSQYCRTKGLYSEQVTSWKQVCNTHSSAGRPANSAEHKADKKRIKSLERESSRTPIT